MNEKFKHLLSSQVLLSALSVKSLLQAHSCESPTLLQIWSHAFSSLLSQGGCDHHCNDKDGKVECSCEIDYELDADKHSCNKSKVLFLR